MNDFRWLTSGGSLPALAMLAFIAPATSMSQDRPVPDTFKATTTAMSPEGLEITIEVLEWSDESARAATIDALRDDEDVRSALVTRPTVGYVWTGGSSVGYSIKYAYREPADGGGERVTIVTDRVLGSYSFRPWEIDGAEIGGAAGEAPDLDYSVIELSLDGGSGGVGTLSPAAPVTFDDEAQTVALELSDTTPMVLSNAREEPKPYWASGSY